MESTTNMAEEMRELATTAKHAKIDEWYNTLFPVIRDHFNSFCESILKEVRKTAEKGKDTFQVQIDEYILDYAERIKSTEIAIKYHSHDDISARIRDAFIENFKSLGFTTVYYRKILAISWDR